MGQRHYKESIVRGRNTEARFESAITQQGWQVIRKADKQEQLHAHWDILIQHGNSGSKHRFEIKGPKRFHRYKGIQYDYILLELHGGDYIDNAGWLYDTAAEMIAFELKEEFVCFDVSELKRFIKEEFGIRSADDPKIFDSRILSATYKDSPHTETVPYQIYHRLNKDGDDNFDAFIWIPLTDLLKKISCWKVAK